MSAPAHRPQDPGPQDPENEPGGNGVSPFLAAPGDHLPPDEIYELIEKRLSRRKLRAAEAHLDACTECVETLAMVLRAERPASREEQEVLAGIPEPTSSELLEAMRPRIGPRAPREEWKPILATFVVAALLVALSLFVRNQYWLPAASRRAARETLSAVVNLRQATGRLPLRYITEFDRAGIVRSGFDTTDDAEQGLIFNLRAAVERSPEPEAVLVLGLLLLDDGELDEAERLLTRVTEERPDSVDALNGLAVVYYEKARRNADDAYALQQEGLAFLREAERLDPTDLRVLFNYGKFYEALDMQAAASKSWQRYLEHDKVSQWADDAAMQLAQ